MPQVDRDLLRWLEPESDPLATARGVFAGALIGGLAWLVLAAGLALASCAPSEQLGCLSQELARSGAPESVIAAMGGCQ
jgi:hypothetical protein